MKGSSRTIRVHERLSKTNFDDWSDPLFKLPPKSERRIPHCESLQLSDSKANISDESLKSDVSKTSVELNEMRDIIRKGYPLMTKKEIRDFRLPFHESLLLNLKEDGFLLTYEFIKDLIAIDDAYHKDLETDFNLKNRPILKFSKSVLIPLSKGLEKAETSRLNNEKNQEATAFLDLATLFSTAEDPSWYWIALEMFEQCMEVMKNVEKPVDLQLQATAKYFFGLFLFYELHDLNEAKSQTESSMSISESKYWMIQKDSDSKEKKGVTLYDESCILLHKIFLEMAQREMIHENTEEAIQLCRNGLLWAKVLNNKVAEANALRKLINIYLSVQQLFSIPELLKNYMKLCTELEDFEGLCEGYILQARYHDNAGENASVIEDIKSLLQVAKENCITKMVAMAHHKLATYCLLRGAEKELLDHAIEAYISYLNLKKNVKYIEEARCLVGVAQAQEVMPEYCNMVVEADSFNLIEQLVLFRWKNLRIPFFDKKLVLIPEIFTNTNLLDRVEAKRIDELLAHVYRRQSDLVTVTSRRMSDLTSASSKMPSLARLNSKPPSILSSLKEQGSISIRSEDNKFKTRAISFFEDNKGLRSVSAVMDDL